MFINTRGGGCQSQGILALLLGLSTFPAKSGELIVVNSYWRRNKNGTRPNISPEQC